MYDTDNKNWKKSFAINLNIENHAAVNLFNNFESGDVFYAAYIDVNGIFRIKKYTMNLYSNY